MATAMGAATYGNKDGESAFIYVLRPGLQLLVPVLDNRDYNTSATWLTTHRCLAGSFDIIWQLQNIITSDGESLRTVITNVNFILPAKPLSLAVSRSVRQSPSSPHQFSLDVAALFALSIVISSAAHAVYNVLA